MSTQTKPSIVFAHGLWADGSCYSKVIPTLQAEGHEVVSAQNSLDTLEGDVAAVKRRCAAEGVNPGVDIQALTGREEDRGGLLVAITEQRSRADIDRLADVLGAAVAAELADSRAVAVPA